VAARAGASLNAMLKDFHSRDDGVPGNWEPAHMKPSKEERMAEKRT
jgi:hypothetical protein